MSKNEVNIWRFEDWIETSLQRDTRTFKEPSSWKLPYGELEGEEENLVIWSFVDIAYFLKNPLYLSLTILTIVLATYIFTTKYLNIKVVCVPLPIFWPNPKRRELYIYVCLLTTAIWTVPLILFNRRFKR